MRVFSDFLLLADFLVYYCKSISRSSIELENFVAVNDQMSPGDNSFSEWRLRPIFRLRIDKYLFETFNGFGTVIKFLWFETL